MNYASEKFFLATPLGKINPEILVGDICVNDPFSAGGTWFLSGGRNIQQSLAGDG